MEAKDLAVSDFIKNRRGSVAVEYAVIAGGIAVAIAGVVFALGAGPVLDLWNSIVAGAPG